MKTVKGELQKSILQNKKAATEKAAAEAASAKRAPAKDQPKEGAPEASVVFMHPVELHFEQLSKYQKEKAKKGEAVKKPKESKKLLEAKVGFPDTFQEGLQYGDALHRLLDGKNCDEKVAALQEAKGDLEVLGKQLAAKAFTAIGERGAHDLAEIVATHRNLTDAFEQYEKAIPENEALELTKREHKQLQNDVRKLQDANKALLEDKEELHKTIRSFAPDGSKGGGASAGDALGKSAFSGDDLLKLVAGMSGQCL